jgi:hypothetical protein
MSVPRSRSTNSVTVPTARAIRSAEAASADR